MSHTWVQGDKEQHHKLRISVHALLPQYPSPVLTRRIIESSPVGLVYAVVVGIVFVSALLPRVQ